MILRTFKRIADEPPEEARSTSSSPEQRELERQLAQDAERAVESIAARYLVVHLKAAEFQSARRHRVHTIAPVQHQGAPLTLASQRHALGAAILERYLKVARLRGLLEFDPVDCCEVHAIAVQRSCSPHTADDPSEGLPRAVSVPAVRSP